MQHYTVLLSSYQILGIPNFLNHYIFVDPVNGTSFVYPNTANGSNFALSLCAAAIPENFWLSPSVTTSYSGNGNVAYDFINQSKLILSGVNYKSAFFDFYNVGAGINSKEYMFNTDIYSQYLNFGINKSFTIIAYVSSMAPSTWGAGSGDRRVISKGHWALSPGYFISVNSSGIVRTGIGSTQGFAPGSNCMYFETFTSPINFNGVNQIAITVDRSSYTFCCYVNGVQQYLIPARDQNVTYLFDTSGFNINFSSIFSTACASSNKRLFIGGADENVGSSDAGQFFNGILGDIKIFDRALTNAEIILDSSATPYYNSLLYASNATTPSYAVTANGGLFFPWGYIKSNVTQNIDIGKFKGPTTITFNPSAIDYSLYPIVKIYYDFGDGHFTDVERNIYGQTISINTDYVFLSTGLAGIPNNYLVSHTYWPGVHEAPYVPSISAIASDGVYNIFNISLTSVPDSIYSITDMRLLNKLDIDNRGKNKLIVSESKYNDYFLNNLVLEENVEAVFPTPTPTPTPTVTPTITPTPTLTPTPTVTNTPTPTPTPTVTPTPTPTVTNTPTPTPTITPTPTPTPLPCPSSITITGAGTTIINGTYTLSADIFGSTLFVNNANSSFIVVPTDTGGAPDITSAVIVSAIPNTVSSFTQVTGSMFYASSAAKAGFCIPLGSTYDVYLSAYIFGISAVELKGATPYPTVN